MNELLGFLADNYIYFMIGSGVLLIALIGFAVSLSKEKKGQISTEPVANNQNVQPVGPVSVGAPTSPVQPTTSTPVNVQPQVIPSVSEPATTEPTLTFQSQPEVVNNTNTDVVNNSEPVINSQVNEPKEEQLTFEPVSNESLNVPTQEPAEVNAPVVENSNVAPEPVIEIQSQPEPIVEVQNVVSNVNPTAPVTIEPPVESSVASPVVEIPGTTSENATNESPLV